MEADLRRHVEELQPGDPQRVIRHANPLGFGHGRPPLRLALGVAASSFIQAPEVIRQHHHLEERMVRLEALRGNGQDALALGLADQRFDGRRAGRSPR